MSTNEIYRIKIKQLQLRKGSPPFNYFPFDNIYLVPKESPDLAYRLFRYSLILDLTEPLKAALHGVNFMRERTITMKRDDIALEGKRQQISDTELNNIINKREWLGVVPTYAIIAPKQPAEDKQKQLHYLITHAIKSLHNTYVVMPNITLKTPRRIIPALCALCKYVAEYYQNKCTPASFKCRSKIYLNDLDVDESNQESVTNSIENAGEVE